MDRTNLDARWILALLALHGHVEESLFWHSCWSIIMVAFFHVHRAVRHLQHADVLNLWIARLIVFFHAGMNAFAAADASSQVQTINKFDAVHRLEIANMRADSVLALDFILNPFEDLLHVFGRQFLVILLQELFCGWKIFHLH